jgi:MFS family permease
VALRGLALSRPGGGPGRDASLLVASAIVSSAGDWLYRLALPLVVYELTHSAIGTAATYALEFGPYLLLSPAGGLLADRVDRRRLLIASDAAAAVLAGALALLLATGRPALGLVLALALLMAALAPTRHPAFHALLPAVVGAERDLLRANARLQGGESVVGVAGPVLAGVVIAAFGTTTALALDAASFLACALAVAALRHRDAARAAAHGGAGEQLREALAFVRRDRVVRAGVAVFAGANFAVFLVEANLIYALLAFEHVDRALIGVVFSAQGVGALCGAMLAAPLGRRFALGRVIVGATITAGAATLLLLVASGVATIAAAWALESACGSLTAVTWFSLRAMRTPDALLGRVVALTRMAAFASIPAGALAGGALLALSGGLGPLILASGALQLAIGAAALRTALWAPTGRQAERATLAPAESLP